jgi:hypothetical protein
MMDHVFDIFLAVLIIRTSVIFRASQHIKGQEVGRPTKRPTVGGN